MEENAIGAELCIRLRVGALLPLLEALEGAAVGRTSAQDREWLQELAGALRAALGSPQPPAVAKPPAEPAETEPPPVVAAPADPARREIVAHARYLPEEAGRMLGFGERWKSIYDIPAALLPRCRVGARGGRVLFLGSDLLAYLDRARRPGLRR